MQVDRTVYSYYDVLEIDRNASQEQVRTARNTLAKKYHPDVNKSVDAGKRFCLIQEAFEILSNPIRKSRYDQQLDQRWKQQLENSRTYSTADNELLVLRVKKSDILPKHADWCSCMSCVNFWLHNQDEYEAVRPYDKMVWHRSASTPSEEFIVNHIGPDIALPSFVDPKSRNSRNSRDTDYRFGRTHE